MATRSENPANGTPLCSVCAVASGQYADRPEDGTGVVIFFACPSGRRPTGRRFDLEQKFSFMDGHYLITVGDRFLMN